ncbi:MAG: hypothetical protein J7641_15650 [Cyanobacteria bacterium SID2]|nr:hypothetical protein [Cyanobacteria bacterium SID2]MBP0003314.1 hypothetical protein [Cyanobacteria bacterium SBC]
MWWEMLLVIGLGLTPPVLSLWYACKAQRQIRDRLMAARDAVPPLRVLQPIEPAPLEILGDRTCLYNARSPYLRCAVNPYGPCNGCRFYREQQAGISHP